MVFNDEIVNMMNIKIEEYYICYFDILGYREYMESNPAKHKSFLANLEAIVAKVQKLIQENCNGFSIQYRTYSDNFLLFSNRATLQNDEEMLKTFSRIIRKIQIILLADFNLLIRGGITIGEFYADERIVFGSGLVRAYELEATIAKMPRIVIDKEAFDIDIYSLVQSGSLAIDYDELLYVNFFYDENCLKYIRGGCINLIQSNCKYHYNIKDKQKILQRESIIEKYIWLLIKYNSQCINLGCQNLLIDYKLRINERLMKTEVEIFEGAKKENPMMVRRKW